MVLRITGGQIIDPSRKLKRVGDLVIAEKVLPETEGIPAGCETIDAKGCWVVPGLIDAHVHLREPGGEQKETIETGLRAAAAGGFTAVMSMPNTSPPNDSPAITRETMEKARALKGTNLYPIPAATVGRRGEQLGPLADLVAAGAVAFSDDGSAIADDKVMELALIKCGELGVAVAQHAEDPNLSRNGAIHGGQVAKKLGIPGWPAEAEERIVARDISLCEKTGGRVHVQHISTKGAVDLVREAKSRGLPVTAEVTPHHLLLTDEAVLEQGALAKVNPPLRTDRDVTACRKALSDGTIDIVATDHAPHTAQDKKGGLRNAAFGLVGLETAVPLLLLLVEKGVLSAARMIEAMSTAPARIFGLPGGTLAPGATADVTIIDPGASHIIDPDEFQSKGRNTPFSGWKVPGRAVCTIVSGRVTGSAGDR